MSAGTFAVVGGGIVGLTIASQLLQELDVKSVVLIEQSEPLAGISGYAGAGDLPIYWSPRHSDLIARSWVYHDAHSSPIGRTRHPVAWFGFDEDESISILGGVTSFRQAPRELHDSLLRDVNPAVSGRATSSWAYRISPRVFGRSLLSGVMNDERFTLIRGEVTDTLSSVSGVTIRFHERCDLLVDRVIVAVGPWVLSKPNSWAEAAAAVGIRTKRVFGLRARLEPGRRGSTAFADADEATFILPTSHPDEIAMSIRHSVWDVPPGTAPLPDELRDRGEAAVAKFTTWGSFRSVEPRVHVDTYTADSTPRVITLDGGRIVIVTATHGSGIRLAPALAQDAVRVVLGTSSPVGGVL